MYQGLTFGTNEEPTKSNIKHLMKLSVTTEYVSYEELVTTVSSMSCRNSPIRGNLVSLTG